MRFGEPAALPGARYLLASQQGALVTWAPAPPLHQLPKPLAEPMHKAKLLLPSVGLQCPQHVGQVGAIAGLREERYIEVLAQGAQEGAQHIATPLQCPPSPLGESWQSRSPDDISGARQALLAQPSAEDCQVLSLAQERYDRLEALEPAREEGQVAETSAKKKVS